MKNEISEREGETVCPVPVEEKLPGWGYRHQQCFILFLCLTTAYSMRVCISVALVAMTEGIHGGTELLINPNVTSAFNGTSSKHGAEQEEHINGLLFIPPYPKFNWSKKTQDTIQSSFYWGYMLLQLPAGHLLHQSSARWLITGALLINCFVSIMLPSAAYYGGWILMAAFRVTQGLAQAFVIPGITTFLGKWAPLEERGRLSAIVFGGQAIGTVLGLPITGFLASSPLGWPGIFRFYGLLCGAVAALLWKFGADSPAQHRSISAAERDYIEDKLGHSHGKVRRSVPWGKILRCRGMYANVVAHVGTTWGQLTLFSEVPAYMDQVMGVDIKANGLLSALPFLVMWFTNFFFSWFTDMLIVKKLLNVTNTRKLANSLGSIPPAIGLIVLAYAPHNIYVVEAILIVVCSFKIATHAGYVVNQIDITPNYSGTLMSISNFVSNLCGSAAPLVAGYILTDASNVMLWRKVFFVAAGVYFFTNLVYVALGTAEKAEWNEPEEEDIEMKDEVIKPMLKQ